MLVFPEQTKKRQAKQETDERTLHMMQEALTALQKGDEVELLAQARTMQYTCLGDYAAHVYLYGVFMRLGMETDALSEAALALAAAPHLSVPYHLLAKHLLRLGNRPAAELMLQKGWEKCERDLPKHLRAAEKEKYFACLNHAEKNGEQDIGE